MDSELIGYLLAAAASLSGYPAIDPAQLPPIEQLSHEEIARQVCPTPEEASMCNGLAAVFDTDGYRILVDRSLDLDKAADNSFLVHELVHVLQYRKNGDAIFATCPANLKTETEAYRAQNAYLKREGEFLRFGAALRFMACAPARPQVSMP